MIRKEGKARWTYTCKLCQKKWTTPDQFRAIERWQRHERSMDHLVEAIAAAFKPATEVFRNLSLAWGLTTDITARAVAQNQELYALAPPSITPRRHSADAEGA